MVKPAPTRIKSKAPISLSPVRALSGAVPAEPVKPAASAPPPVAATPAPTPAPKPPEAKPLEAKAPEATAPEAKPLEAKPAAPAATKPVPPSSPATRPAETKPAAKPPVAKQAARSIKPAAVVAPVSSEAVAKAVVAPVKTATQVAEAVVKAAKAAPAPSLLTMPLPRPPEFATITSTTVMTQALVMAKAFGALQAKMLDHACTELKATLGDAETLARTDSAADAVVLQAKAVRRSYESYAEHLKELARIASKAMGKD